MAEFGLVADDGDRHFAFPATPEKSIHALNHFCLREAFSVNLSLQLLPRQFAVRKQPDRIADSLLSADEVRPNKAPLPRRRQKHGIVADDCIIEIEPNSKAVAHFFAAMLCRPFAAACSAFAAQF